MLDDMNDLKTKDSANEAYGECSHVQGRKMREKISPGSYAA